MSPVKGKVAGWLILANGFPVGNFLSVLGHLVAWRGIDHHLTPVGRMQN
jgi:hypothetical protein